MYTKLEAEIGIRQRRADSQGQNGGSNYGLHTIGKVVYK
jgi:hypothetical protein